MFCFILTLAVCIFATNTLTSTNNGLLSAAESGDVTEVGRQLVYGADVNAKSNDGTTPLHFATLSGHKDIAELLISRGADINAMEKHGGTPLYFAAVMGYKDIAELLIAKGARVDTLNIAALWGNKDLAELLIAKGADANDQEKVRIQKLQTNQLARNEKYLWQRVQSGEDAKTVQTYLDQYLVGSHAAAIAARQEQQLWQQAQAGGNAQTVQAYLDKYPNGSHVAAAQEKLAAISKVKVEASAPKAEAPILDCPDCPQLAIIPAGSYDMGETGPKHRVTLKSFALGKTEVTQGQWKAVMGNNPSHFARCGDNCPVEQVSWNDVQAFIQKLNAKTGKQYRLPSEAEWEYACRAGGQQEYCGSNNLDAVAWYEGNSGGSTHPVAGKQPNAFGLYDMSGNVWEWVEDCYSGDCVNRVIRGGSWYGKTALLLASYRLWFEPTHKYFNDGFRLALPVK